MCYQETMAESAFHQSLDAFREECNKTLGRWITNRRKRAVESGTEGIELVDTVARLVDAGGKRVRPAIVWFSHLACGGQEKDRAMLLAIACELLHTYLLVHDDIMDHAELRRGESTAHVEFTELHDHRAWNGDAQDYGRSMGILAGDLAGSWSSEAANMAFAGLEADLARGLGALFFGMCEEVIWGQHLEMRVAVRRTAPADDLARVLRLKSGCYTVERPLQLGATLAGAEDDVLKALSRYGGALGEAFQLRDDLLGMFGDPADVGKPVGGDLVEGKLTFIIHHALQAASPAQKAEIHDVLGNRELPPDQVTHACVILEELGARTAVQEMIDQRLGIARTALDGVSHRLEPQGHQVLDGLIGYLGDRRS
jgi:geranylgeranyl diphosphate synthase type I